MREGLKVQVFEGLRVCQGLMPPEFEGVGYAPSGALDGRVRQLSRRRRVRAFKGSRI